MQKFASTHERKVFLAKRSDDFFDMGEILMKMWWYGSLTECSRKLVTFQNLLLLAGHFLTTKHSPLPEETKYQKKFIRKNTIFCRKDANSSIFYIISNL